MYIQVNEPNRLVLQNRSVLMGIVLALGAVLSVTTVISVAVWGVVNISTQQPTPTFYWMRLFGLGVVFALGCLFAGVGALTAVNVLRGTTCTFDRAAETVTIVNPNGLRTDLQQHSIYGVSHARLEDNQELHTVAIYLVLRSGKHIPLGTFSHFDKDHAESVVQNVRAFLIGR